MDGLYRTIISGWVSGSPLNRSVKAFVFKNTNCRFRYTVRLTYGGQSRISVKSSFDSEHSSREGESPRALPEEGATRVPVND
ncbi:MAG: hypothetical protein NT010_08665 [Proteobacteria bacterium]|nr:hypothetical protein [Pseudomonadota bacterium]